MTRRSSQSIQAASKLGDIHYVRQGDPHGLGHAVLRAKQHVGDEAFAVLLGDDLIDARDELLSTMIDVQAKTGGSVVALIEVEPAQISAYGCADVQELDGEGLRPRQRLVEKPARGGSAVQPGADRPLRPAPRRV